MVRDSVSKLWDLFTVMPALGSTQTSKARAESWAGDAPIHVTWDVDVRNLMLWRVLTMAIDGDL